MSHRVQRLRAAVLVFALPGILALDACEGSVGGRRDQGRLPDAPAGDGAAADAGKKKDTRPGTDAKKDPCKPRPKACRCASACDATSGACNNSKCPCLAIPGVSYGKQVASKPSTRDMSKHGDVNLLLRKRRAVSATKGLIQVNGPTDNKPGPQLYALFTDDRVPVLSALYQVENWDWGCNCPKGYITKPEVTLAGMATKPGEVIRTPYSGYDIGGGHTAMVLYAAPGTLTLKYTAEDNVVYGYTVHLSGICVEPGLQALYAQCDAAGRKQLPVLRSRQPVGRAVGGEIQTAIRDTGSWMDPRVRKDWWQGK